jgi:WD40 repeat protein
MTSDMMIAMRHCLITVVLTCAWAAIAAAQEAKPAAPAAPKITYDEHIRPILREHCFSCHSADKQESGLQLDSYQKAMAGGSSGEVVLPGDLASSRLWALVSHAEEPKMPPKQDKLAAAKLDLISKWIEQGAPENAGSKVTLKKNPLAAVAAAATSKLEGPPPMPEGLIKQPVLYTKRPGQITALAASPWAPLVAVAGQKQVSLYQSESGDLLGILPFPEGIPHVIRFSRNGSVVLIAGGRGGQSGCVVLFDVKTGKRIAKIGDELDAVLAADLSANQTLVALGGPNRVVRIYSAQTGELLHEIRKHTDWIYAVEFSPDGKQLATADRSGGLFVWEAETAREVQNLRGHNGAIFDVAWRLDSGLLASAGEDTTIKLWNIDEGKAVKSWNAHTGGAFCVRFAHDGRLVTAGRDNTVKTWAADGAAQKSMPSFAEPALRCAFTQDGQHVIGGDWLGNVKIWTAADAKELRSVAANPPTLALRVEAARADLASKQVAADTAKRELESATKTAAEAKKAHDAALASQKALAAAKEALAPINAAPPAGVKPETIKAAIDSVSAASTAADAATEKAAKDLATADADLVTKKKAADAALAALDPAKKALAAAEADQRAFDELAGTLVAAETEAKKRLEARMTEHVLLQTETAGTAEAAAQKSAAVKTLSEQLASLKAELKKAEAEQKAAEDAAAAKAKASADAQQALAEAQAATDAAEADRKAFAAAYGK